MFLRRLGPDPHANSYKTPCLMGCQDIFELECGDFALIGKNITAEAVGKLSSFAGCGPDEAVIRIPRRTLVLGEGRHPGRPVGPLDKRACRGIILGNGNRSMDCAKRVLLP